MSILNHSIPSKGQPLLPPKVSSAKDSLQHLSIPHPNPSKKNTLIISNTDPVIYGITESFLCPLSENEKFIRIDDYVTSTPNIVLSVTVSSAMKLDSRQIELIAKKMQRLTGFRNLKLENIVDASLIAGFIISYGDDESNVIDLSVKAQLASLAARVESSEKRIANNEKSWRDQHHEVM